MPGPSIYVMANGRIATRDATRTGAGVNIQIDDDETIPVAIDWSGWLGTDTISSVTNSATGATVSGASNTNTTAAFSISGATSAIIEHRITTAAGAIKEMPIFINGTSGFYGGGRYYD